MKGRADTLINSQTAITGRTVAFGKRGGATTAPEATTAGKSFSLTSTGGLLLSGAGAVALFVGGLHLAGLAGSALVRTATVAPGAAKPSAFDCINASLVRDSAVQQACRR